MKKISLVSLIAVVWMFSLSTGCKKDKPNNPSTKDSTAYKDSLSLEINQFIWFGLGDYYLWNDSVPNLSQTKYTTWNALNNFLKPYNDHELLFNTLLYPVRDKWSWIVTDYSVLEKEFQGISKSYGFEFGLVLYGGGNSVFGYVKYVVKNSPAYTAGLKRGDIFIKVNGSLLTKSNYQDLLFNSSTYDLGMAVISNNTISPNNIQYHLVPVELAEDPIFLDTIYTINGQKIGYLVYNQFVSNYDLELNGVFKKFQGIDQLILDLRYNPGGSVQTAKYMCSMIYSNNSSLVVLKTQYNAKLESYLLGKYGATYFDQNFPESVEASNGNPADPITPLNLSKLCVITTGNTASASELVINALKAYIPVSVIGTNTVGKYVASITLYDYNDNGIYDTIAGGKVNKKHKYAMQPIILKVANKNGVSDFYNGFTPDFVISEYDYLGKFKQFGDITEPLLNAAINNVLGQPQTKSVIVSHYSRVADSRERLAHYNEMYFRPGELNLNNLEIRNIQKSIFEK